MSTEMTVVLVFGIVCFTIFVLSLIFVIALRIVTKKEDEIQKYKDAQCPEAHKDGTACKPWKVAQGVYECVFRDQ